MKYDARLFSKRIFNVFYEILHSFLDRVSFLGGKKKESNISFAIFVDRSARVRGLFSSKFRSPSDREYLSGVTQARASNFPKCRSPSRLALGDNTIISTTNYNLRDFGIGGCGDSAGRNVAQIPRGEIYATLIPSVIIACPRVSGGIKTLAFTYRLNATNRYPGITELGSWRTKKKEKSEDYEI